MTLKITEITIKDKSGHKSDVAPSYECDITVKQYDKDGKEYNWCQLDVKNMSFSEELLSRIAKDLLKEFKDKIIVEN